jgi:ATP-dependent Lon protease
VLFITTANLLDTIPRPLLDRMEVLELPGYITLEKIEIAKRYLIPRQIEENGIPAKAIHISDAGLRHIVNSYTREAGVRELERKIATICRKQAKRYASGKRQPARVKEGNVRKFLGLEEYSGEIALKRPTVGVATGLAKTMSGGEILFIEALKMPGRGGMKLTGQLGDVMKESAEAAVSFIRAHYLSKAPVKDFFERNDIHIHVPAGAVPKDGPSAGVAIAASIASLLFDRPLRNDCAMTGEITLTGKVLPIGGLKDKVIAAHRAGIKTIIFPKGNLRELEEIPATIKKDLRFVPIVKADEAIERMILWD